MKKKCYKQNIQIYTNLKWRKIIQTIKELYTKHMSFPIGCSYQGSSMYALGDKSLRAKSLNIKIRKDKSFKCPISPEIWGHTLKRAHQSVS